jgi:hypothetical protein
MFEPPPQAVIAGFPEANTRRGLEAIETAEGERLAGRLGDAHVGRLAPDREYSEAGGSLRANGPQARRGAHTRSLPKYCRLVQAY